MFNILYWLIGFFTFIPLEIFQGFYLGYLLILLLGLIGSVRAGSMLVAYFLFCIIVLFATILSAEPKLTSIVNPIMSMFAIILTPACAPHVRAFVRGFVASGCTHALLLLLFASFYDAANIIAFLWDRLWGLDYLPYFGNGFAMLFPFAIILLLALSKLFSVFLLCIGGVLTTSRIPIAFVFATGAFSATKNKYAFFSVIVVTVSMLVVFADELLWFYDGIKNRLLQSNDRMDLYSLALTEIEKSPLLGHGPVEIEYYVHAHNSLLHVSYRYGVFAAGIWLVLCFQAFFRPYLSGLNFLFLLAVSLVSFTQIGLFHPNVILAALFTRWHLDYVRERWKYEF